MRRGQPAADLRPDHRVGPGRPAGEDGRPRHQLPVADRRAVAPSATGRPPVAPLNLVADFGGGSMLVLVGIVAALYEREHSGKGQVIDAAMVDGVSMLSQMVWTMKARARSRTSGSRSCSTAARRSTGPTRRPTAVHGGRGDRAAVLRTLLDGLGLSRRRGAAANGPIGVRRDARLFAERFASRTRDEWQRSSRAPTRASRRC